MNSVANMVLAKSAPAASATEFAAGVPSSSSARPVLFGPTAVPAIAACPPGVTAAQARPRPFMPIRGACSLLDLDEDGVLRLLEDGTMAWAWDVCLDPKHTRSREIRIFPPALAAYMRGQAYLLEWPQILRLILPNDDAWICAGEIRRFLNVSGTLVYALVRANVLVPRSTSWRSGPGGGTSVARDSVKAFLEDRRL